LKVGEITKPNWSDRNAMNPRSDSKPFAKAAGNYSFGDLSKVTHNQLSPVDLINRARGLSGKSCLVVPSPSFVFFCCVLVLMLQQPVTRKSQPRKFDRQP
jgi:hypothetical protein